MLRPDSRPDQTPKTPIPAVCGFAGRAVCTPQEATTHQQTRLNLIESIHSISTRLDATHARPETQITEWLSTQLRLPCCSNCGCGFGCGCACPRSRLDSTTTAASLLLRNDVQPPGYILPRTIHPISRMSCVRCVLLMALRILIGSGCPQGHGSLSQELPSLLDVDGPLPRLHAEEVARYESRVLFWSGFFFR